jgi:hypothetical protein
MASLWRVNYASITPPYTRLIDALSRVRRSLGPKPLTLAEKILYAHAFPDSLPTLPQRGQSYLHLRPQRVAMQDASAQSVPLSFLFVVAHEYLVVCRMALSVAFPALCV